MASLVKGFEYDIFVSYRQKDNKYDGWVTEFLANLRKELEATFKEDISIYSDENKLDGLRETDLIDESLTSKLKCLIFIPILSQTYCDPKSYAWKNEFLVFKELARDDPYGLKVRMWNGNVASRIVPIRIHDLDLKDKFLFEETVGGQLRSIDFVFRATGVNRPLRAHEDRAGDNLNKTYYRDQINKVANLVREIVEAMKSRPEGVTVSEPERQPKPSSFKSYWRALAATVFVASALTLIYYLRDGGTAISKPATERISIAVLPFKTIGKEEDSQYFADGVMEVILSNLTYFPELSVKSGFSVEKYRDHPKSTPEIATELNVQYVLKGSAQKLGEDIRIVVQLVDAQSDVNIWSENFVRKFSNVFEIQNQISEEVARSLKAKLTADINARIDRKPTTNFEAYDLFLKAKLLTKKFESDGNSRDLDSAIGLMKKSLKKDDQFAQGYAWLAGLKAIHDLHAGTDPHAKDSVLLLATRAVEIDSTIVESYLVLSQVYNYVLDDVNALRFTYKALETINDDTVTSVELIKRLATIYSRVGDIDKAIYLYEQLELSGANGPEIIHQKFFPLAAGGRTDLLVSLAEKARKVDDEDLLQDLIMSHVFTERNDNAGLEKIYRSRILTDGDWTMLDQYIMIFATALKANGKTQEANQLAVTFEKEFAGEDPYLLAQAKMYQGQFDEGLRLLGSVEIGSYNLTLCSINPVFDKVRNDTRFKEFIERNRNRIIDRRERINQLEDRGLLPGPENFFKTNAII